MSKFKIGQEVICIRGHIPVSSFPPLIDGETYTILGFKKCQCQDPMVDVGLLSANNTKCSVCSKIIIGSEWWLRENRFVSLDELKESEEVGEEMINEMHVNNIMA
jgi:hypothetical protein